MANKFKSIDDHVYRVVGELADGTIEVLQGPYASRAVARSQATANRTEQAYMEYKYGKSPKYVDIYAQETVPDWFRV